MGLGVGVGLGVGLGFGSGLAVTKYRHGAREGLLLFTHLATAH